MQMLEGEIMMDAVSSTSTAVETVVGGEVHQTPTESNVTLEQKNSINKSDIVEVRGDATTGADENKEIMQVDMSSSSPSEENRLYHQEGADLLLSLAETASEHAKIREHHQTREHDLSALESNNDDRGAISTPSRITTMVSSPRIDCEKETPNGGQCIIEEPSIGTTTPIQRGMRPCDDDEVEDSYLRTRIYSSGGSHHLHASPINTSSSDGTGGRNSSNTTITRKPITTSNVIESVGCQHAPRGMVPVMWSPTYYYGRGTPRASVPISDDKRSPSYHYHQHMDSYHDSIHSSPLVQPPSRKRPSSPIVADDAQTIEPIEQGAIGEQSELKKARYCNAATVSTESVSDIEGDTDSTPPKTDTINSSTIATDARGNVIISPSSSNERSDESDDHHSDGSNVPPMHPDQKQHPTKIPTEDPTVPVTASAQQEQHKPQDTQQQRFPQNQQSLLPHLHVSHPPYPLRHHSSVPFYPPGSTGHPHHPAAYLYMPPPPQYGKHVNGRNATGIVPGSNIPYGLSYRYSAAPGHPMYMQQHPAAHYYSFTRGPIGFGSNGMRPSMPPMPYNLARQSLSHPPPPQVVQLHPALNNGITSPTSNSSINSNKATDTLAAKTSIATGSVASPTRDRSIKISKTKLSPVVGSSSSTKCKGRGAAVAVPLNAYRMQQQRQLHESPMTSTQLIPTANSKTKCIQLKNPVSSRSSWNNFTDYDSIKIPDFMRLVNFPDYLARGRSSGGHRDNAELSSVEGMKHCVMCGKLRICSANGVITSQGSSARKDAGSALSESSVNANNNEEDAIAQATATTHIIPRQNKGVCTACDVAVWIIVPESDDNNQEPNAAESVEIKWCKGCKNFRPWVSFGEKGLATKCVRCRTRQKEKYAIQKKEISAVSNNSEL